jgi:hypothetical protein
MAEQAVSEFLCHIFNGLWPSDHKGSSFGGLLGRIRGTAPIQSGSPKFCLYSSLHKERRRQDEVVVPSKSSCSCVKGGQKWQGAIKAIIACRTARVTSELRFSGSRAAGFGAPGPRNICQAVKLWGHSPRVQRPIITRASNWPRRRQKIVPLGSCRGQ